MLKTGCGTAVFHVQVVEVLKAASAQLQGKTHDSVSCHHLHSLKLNFVVQYSHVILHLYCNLYYVHYYGCQFGSIWSGRQEEMRGIDRIWLLPVGKINHDEH